MDKHCKNCSHCEMTIQGCHGVVGYFCNKLHHEIDKESCCQFYHNYLDDAEVDMLNEDQKFYIQTKRFN